MKDDSQQAPTPPPSDRIDVQDEASVADWSDRLDVTSQQIKDAVAEVGDLASDVELHLKGARSGTNKDQVDRLS